MPIFTLDMESQQRLEKVAETGMGYHFLKARCGSPSNNRKWSPFSLVLSSTYSIPLKSDGGIDVPEFSSVFDLDDVQKDEPEVPLRIEDDYADRTEEARQTMAFLLRVNFVPLPPIPVPPPGAALPIITRSNGFDAFLRFYYSRKDPRTPLDGQIPPKTYATTYLDGCSISSGLSAVGRYALPVPLPARFAKLLTPPLGTTVHFGTCLSMFGLGGGGVEAYFPAGFLNTWRVFKIPAY